MFLSNSKVGQRLLTGFGSSLLLLIAVALVSWISMDSTTADTTDLLDRKLKNERLARDWKALVETNVQRSMAAPKATDPVVQKFFEDGLASTSKRAEDDQNQMAESLRDPQAKALFATAMEKRALYQAIRKKALEQRSQRSNATVAALTLVSIALSIGLGWLIARSLLNQLGGEPAYAAQITDRIAGDLTVRVDLQLGDQSSLLHSIAAMRQRLAAIVQEVRSGTDAVATASNQIASGKMDLSSRTEQQAGSLEETASSMEELTATVKQHGDYARQANQLAADASGVAVRGGSVVTEAVTMMQSIDASSRTARWTQQNAALVEQAAAAAESLQGQTGRLAEVDSVFKLDGAAVDTASASASVRRLQPKPGLKLAASTPRGRDVAAMADA